jgi:hypothetical protein
MSGICGLTVTRNPMRMLSETAGREHPPPSRVQPTRRASSSPARSPSLRATASRSPRRGAGRQPPRHLDTCKGTRTWRSPAAPRSARRSSPASRPSSSSIRPRRLTGVRGRTADSSSQACTSRIGVDNLLRRFLPWWYTPAGGRPVRTRVHATAPGQQRTNQQHTPDPHGLAPFRAAPARGQGLAPEHCIYHWRGGRDQALSSVRHLGRTERARNAPLRDATLTALLGRFRDPGYPAPKPDRI